MTPENEHRLAVIGLGAVTRNIHLPAYAKLRDRISVIAGCDPDRAARERVGADIGTLYEDAADMLDREAPDLVAICTPPALHREQAILALEKGCHVFCEKPMALSLSDADVMISAANQAGKQIVINTQFPFMRTYQAAKRALGTPEVGELQFLHAWQHFHRTDETEAGWRGSMERRLCLEFGIHVFELARFFFDADPVTLFAHMPNRFTESAADVVNTIALEFPDGRGAAIVLDRLSQGPHRYLELTLDAERASIHTSIGGELRFEIGLETAARRPYAAWHFARGGKSVLHSNGRSNRLATEGLNPFASATAAHLDQFLDAVETGEVPAASAIDNRKTLALALAAYESADARRVVEMNTFAGPA